MGHHSLTAFVGAIGSRCRYVRGHHVDHFMHRNLQHHQSIAMVELFAGCSECSYYRLVCFLDGTRNRKCMWAPFQMVPFLVMPKRWSDGMSSANLGKCETFVKGLVFECLVTWPRWPYHCQCELATIRCILMCNKYCFKLLPCSKQRINDSIGLTFNTWPTMASLRPKSFHRYR